jgi:hypothetical protein
MNRRVVEVQQRLAWMRQQEIWPNGLRYLWTDAYGVVLLVSLYHDTGNRAWLTEAEWVVAEVERVLGRERGMRIGEASDRDGQYYHYLAMWLFALYRLGQVLPAHHDRAIELVHEIHGSFVVPDTGIVWKMQEDLSGPYPGYGLGALDAFHGYVCYRLLDEVGLASEIAELEALVESSYRNMVITQDLALGMMLWMTHFHAAEPWAQLQRERCLAMLDRMWVERDGYFCREPELAEVKFAFTNYGVSVGLQAVDVMPDRVDRLDRFFASYRSGDEYDTAAITHVMACSSALPGALLTADRVVPSS